MLVAKTHGILVSGNIPLESQKLCQNLMGALLVEQIIIVLYIYNNVLFKCCCRYAVIWQYEHKPSGTCFREKEYEKMCVKD